MSGFILDTPEQIEKARQAALYFALKLEVETGLKHSRFNVFQIVKQTWPGVTAKTKRQALVQLYDILSENGVLHSVKAPDGH